jgi:hypothetical protein
LFNRRAVIVGAGTALMGVNWSPGSFAQEIADIIIEGDLPPLPDDLAEFASEPPAPYTELAQVGTGKPTDKEIKRANEILLDSPFGVSHLEIATYFLNLSGSDAVYRREWPVRANPLIYHFFSATLTKPEGDVTPWCAAALNWFLLRSHATQRDEIGKAPGTFSESGKPFSTEHLKAWSTNSASSGSFRCWPALTDEPGAGAIIVLADKGTESLTKYCRGQGHVTIFTKRIDKDWVEAIGGNQSMKGSNGAITRARIYVGEGGRFLKFVA